MSTSQIAAGIAAASGALYNSSLLNAHYNSSLAAMAQGQGQVPSGSWGQTPFIGPNRSPESIRAELAIVTEQESLLRSELEAAIARTPKQGPTPDEISKYPSLKSLWDELRTGMGLVGIHRD